MDRRLEFDEELRELQKSILGYQHTYFEPPENVWMQYDAVVYERNTMHVRRANNKSYVLTDQWDVKVISKDPETALPRAIQEHFERCSPGRVFVRDNLWHFPFTIYY